jgi:hypothetical protein
MRARTRAHVSWSDIDERPCGTGKYQSLVLPGEGLAVERYGR